MGTTMFWIDIVTILIMVGVTTWLYIRFSRRRALKRDLGITDAKKLPTKKLHKRWRREDQEKAKNMVDEIEKYLSTIKRRDKDK